MSVDINRAKPTAVRRLFGTDGVRGVANTELTVELALSLGMAAAHILRAHTPQSNEVVVGRDPRRSGDLLEAALVAGLCAQGVDVTLLGVLPTPGVAFITKMRGALAGIVISASHNPMADNGIKFFGADGKKLADGLEAEIESHLSTIADLPRPSGEKIGAVAHTPDLVEGYVDFLQQSCPVDLGGLNLVVDCANGAAYRIANDVLARLGAEISPLFCTPDGLNINADCGSLHPQTLQERVVEIGADGGLAFDGDADRVILCDERGHLFDGDRILCALAIQYAQLGTLKNSVVVGTTMSNLGLEDALKQRDIRLVRADVGDRYVAEKMIETGAILGGEKSGHILLPHLSTTGDGILTALQVLALCRVSGKSLSEWADAMTEYPQRLVSVRVRERDGWQNVPEIAASIKDAEERLRGRGRINVRPSGTEKLIRVMVESPDAAEVEAIVNHVAAAVRATIGV